MPPTVRCAQALTEGLAQVLVACATGTIFETDKRWKVPYLLYAFFIVFCVELGFLSE